jgi:long-chain fatty acid transport protein
LGLVWPEDSGFRTLTIEGRLQYITVNPVVAWKPHSTLSLAAGPTINYSKLKIRRGLATATDELRFRGDAFDFGFNAGILWQPHEKWSFGANYRAATAMDYEGTAAYNPPLAPGLPTSAHTSAKFDFPQIISAGVSFRPTPDWNFEINADWSDWETLNTVALRGTAPFGFPVGDLPFQLNWRNSWLYEVGVTRRLGPHWSVSAGYFFSGKTTSEADFNPLVPDTDLHVGSLGVTYRTGRWRYALAGQFITGPYRQINTSIPSPAGQSANGQYSLTVPTISFSVGCHF